MATPFRIRATSSSERLKAGAPAATVLGKEAPDGLEPTGVNDYLEKLLKMIPTEVVGLYLVGSGVIPITKRGVLLGWALFCLLCVIGVRILGTRDGARGLGPQWGAVAIAAVAFVIWVYSIGGPFAAYLGSGYQPFIGSLLVLAWTFVVPIVYRPQS
jgi:hypothetical protein